MALTSFTQDTIEKVRGFGGQKVADVNNPRSQNILKYPQNVGSPEVPNYIIFYPLIRSNSAAGQRATASGTAQRVEGGVGTVNIDNSGASTTAAALVAGSIFATGAFSLLANGGKTASAAKGGFLSLVTTAVAKALGGGVAVGAGVAVIAGIQDEDKTIFSNEAIVLQVQDNPKYGYAATWETSELGTVLGAVASGQLDASLNAAGAGAQLLARKAAGAVKAIAGAGGGVSTLIEATSKQTPNPYKEQLFRSVGFREFEFNYRFAPESESEYNGVKGIIERFSFHMHPEQDKSGLFFIYPSEFLIQVYHGEDVNRHVKQMSNCALTQMSIEYGSTGGFTTFKGGVPTEINIRLKFTELELLTNKRIGQGY